MKQLHQRLQFARTGQQLLPDTAAASLLLPTSQSACNVTHQLPTSPRSSAMALFLFALLWYNTS